MIFDEIKKWEKEKFTPLSNNQKDQYINDLIIKKNDLQDKRVKIPTTNANNNKQWRYQSDIEQINWRLRYLRPLAEEPKIVD